MKCWEWNPKDRPSFATLHADLTQILQKYEKLSEMTINFNSPSLTISTINETVFDNNDENSSLLMQAKNSSTLKDSYFGQKSVFNSPLIAETKFKRQSDSDDSQYFSGTDFSGSIINASPASNIYSDYVVPTNTDVKAVSMGFKAPPSPPPPRNVNSLLGLMASAAKQL